MVPYYVGKVIIRKKKGLLDPQKVTLNESLKRIGKFGKNVSVLEFSKYFEIKVLADNKKDAKDQIKYLSEDVLSNPIIEDFEILTVENTDK